MPKDIRHAEVLDEGTLTEVDEALRDLKDNPAALTPELKAQVARFFVDTLLRMYEYWESGKEPAAIVADPFTRSFADQADDEMLFRRAGEVLAPSAPAAKAASGQVRKSVALSAGGRLERRSAEVPGTLRSVFDELCQSSYLPLSEAAKEARARIQEE